MISHAGPKKLEFGRALRGLAINRKIPPDPAFTNPLTSSGIFAVQIYH
jgi:hypothetical protein